MLRLLSCSAHADDPVGGWPLATGRKAWVGKVGVGSVLTSKCEVNWRGGRVTAGWADRDESCRGLRPGRPRRTHVPGEPPIDRPMLPTLAPWNFYPKKWSHEDPVMRWAPEKPNQFGFIRPASPNRLADLGLRLRLKRDQFGPNSPAKPGLAGSTRARDSPPGSR
jgi:hypothetical protein